MSRDYSPSMQQVLECLVTEIGVKSGLKIKEEIAKVVALGSVDLTAIQNAITTINNLLDSDPSKEGFQAGQNIINMLSTLSTRVDGLENDTRVEQMRVVVAGLDVAIKDETTRALAAEAALQQAIDSINTTMVTIQQQLTDLEAGNTGGNGCDCVAIQADISSLQTAVTNLQSADASTAFQIAALQTSISTVTAQAQAAATAAAQALAAANAAASASAANATAIAAVQSQLNSLDERETGRHEQHHGRLNRLEEFKDDVTNISCEYLSTVFERALNS
jgi:chromosome segregation ATPase